MFSAQVRTTKVLARWSWHDPGFRWPDHHSPSFHQSAQHSAPVHFCPVPPLYHLARRLWPPNWMNLCGCSRSPSTLAWSRTGLWGTWTGQVGWGVGSSADGRGEGDCRIGDCRIGDGARWRMDNCRAEPVRLVGLYGFCVCGHEHLVRLHKVLVRHPVARSECLNRCLNGHHVL